MKAQIRMMIAAAAALCAGAVNAEGDAVVGKEKSYTCTGCHGIPAYNNTYPTYHVPKLGGQNYDYIVAALKAYKAGERQHATMQAQATSLSEQDIQDIAAYFVSLTANKGQ